jgi:hypothetical protein
MSLSTSAPAVDVMLQDITVQVRPYRKGTQGKGRARVHSTVSNWSCLVARASDENVLALQMGSCAGDLCLCQSPTFAFPGHNPPSPLTCEVLCCALGTAHHCVRCTAWTAPGNSAQCPVQPGWLPRMSHRQLPRHHCHHPASPCHLCQQPVCVCGGGGSAQEDRGQSQDECRHMWEGRRVGQSSCSQTTLAAAGCVQIEDTDWCGAVVKLNMLQVVIHSANKRPVTDTAELHKWRASVRPPPPPKHPRTPPPPPTHPP